jgi:hypothetical protein
MSRSGSPNAPFSALGLTLDLLLPTPRTMKTNENKETSQDAHSSKALLGIVAAAALLVGLWGPAAGAAAAGEYNNVQLFVTTSSSLPYYYTFTAYNTSGSLIGSYQGPYPAAAFELPTGDYLFTVSAVYEKYYPCQYQCVYAADATASKNGTGIASPAIYYQPSSEYGYISAHIDSSQTLNLATKNVTTFPTEQVTVKVAYVNGTAANGASVSASVVGQWYYWWGQDSKVVMWAQTGPDGIAQLVLPEAPAVVTAWNWVPVNLPPSQTTVVENVGGENVNVTVYWYPSYVGLSASGLLLPPANSLNLTLHYQQPSYWAMPAGTMYASSPMGGSGGATVASQPGGVPSDVRQSTTAQSGQQQYYLPGQIPSTQGGQTAPATSATQGPGGLIWMAAAFCAGLFVALGVSAVALKGKERPSEASP